MADRKEQIAKIEALAKEDEAFRDEYIAAIKTQDADKLAAFLASKGFEVDASDIEFSDGCEPLGYAVARSLAQ